MDPLVLSKPGSDDLPILALSPLRGINSAQQKVDLLNGDTVTISITTTAPLELSLGYTLSVFGQLYTLNQFPQLIRKGENCFDYDLVLEGPQYHLLRVIFFDTDTSGNSLSSTFSLTGNLQSFAQVLFANMARVFSGAWGLGQVKAYNEVGTLVDGAATATKTLSFDNENCLTVLQRLCEEFNSEFDIEYRPNDAPNRILHIRPAGTAKTDQFQYGQGRGLYELSRNNVQNSPFFTRLYCYGSTKNLPYGYRNYATRLQLPLSGPAPTLPTPYDTYVQDNTAVAQYGLIEGTKVFEEIYPARTGTVTASTDQLTFADTSLDFNVLFIDHYDAAGKAVYRYLIPGLTAKVHFQTGSLAGYEFEITGFDPATYTFTIKPYTDDRGLVFPGSDPASPFRISAGDTYVLVDIYMPDSYVEAAEAKLLAAGQAYLADNKVPPFEYSVILDEMYLQKQANDTGPTPINNPPNFFSVGDSVRLIDTALGIDRQIRIMGFTRDLTRPYRYTLTLGDVPKTSLLQKVLSQQASVKKALRNEGLGQPAAPVNTTPSSDKPTKRDVSQLLEALGKPVNHTLFAGILPDGFQPHNQTNLDPYQLIVGVFDKPVSDANANLLGQVKAIARKTPTFPL
ncbi:MULTISPECIES: hypothetical protein [unclassified Spirosoma]|uniref:hypothetical protein n=1 Tax=unclassified Spirosoma TaxID=2621999 RepID=UPI00095BF07C|nr:MULTISPECIES: hypothetical protein [unclassified Spirosoma]MBN8820756.1 phage tail protein [Spirosoma sp.]OJW78054.1 MAG: hypothetical protein BGO59_28980 [Spirosoma sp. 48-14]